MTGGLKELMSDANKLERLQLLELEPIMVRLGAIHLHLIDFLRKSDIQIHSEEILVKLYALRESLDNAITIQKTK